MQQSPGRLPDRRVARPAGIGFAASMIAARRLVLRLHVGRVYGIALDKPQGT